MTVEFLKQDAAEMMRILTSANCIQRHSLISHDRLSEILTAMVTGGTLTLQNKEGHDVTSPKFGRIEVKSRVLGTDGAFPRVSLRASNLQYAEYFVAVRWTRDMDLYEAIGVPRSSAEALYAAKLQKSGRRAHIGWSDWVSAPHARSFREDMQRVFSETETAVPVAM
jgi:hypothetical protein